MSATLQEILAPIPFTERGKSIVISADPKGEKIVFGLGKIVVIREIANLNKCEVYTEHNHKVTVAKYAHHGNYICSGDITGRIRIWDTLDEEHKLKNEFRPFAGEIRDLVWGPEAKRIAVCGQGSDVHGAVIMADSGNNLGKINQVSRRGNSIDFKPNRPYRMIVGDDDFVVSVYEGPPFKPTLNIKDHSRFVNVVRYSPNGKYWASGSSDGHLILYDGKTSDKIGCFGDEKKGAHSGGIYSLAWSPDSTEILTASGDKSAKLWNVESRQEVAHFVIGKDVEDQQYSSAWAGEHLITFSFGGQLNYLDRNNPEKPLRVVYGHNKPISKLISIPSDKACHISADFGGKILWWDTESGEAHQFAGTGHTNKITGLEYDCESKQIVSIGWDDKIRFTCATSFDFSTSTVVGLDSQPHSMVMAAPGCIIANTEASLVLIKDKKKVFELPRTGYSVPSCAAYGNTLVVQEGKQAIKIYNIEGDSLVDSGDQIDCSSAPMVMSFSTDGSMLAVACEDRSITIYGVADGFKQIGDVLWGHHMKVTVLSWSPDSQSLASTSMDSSLRFWRIAEGKNFDVQKAHKGENINALAWQGNDTLLTAGMDCLTKVWKVTW